MKNTYLILGVVAISLWTAAQMTTAQTPSQKAPVVERDSDMEKDAMHNLEVARHYFKQKKAYVAALQRCEEIIAGNPAFAKIDEVLFIAGDSSAKLADGKGKQPSSIYVIREGEIKRTLKPEEFRSKGQGYLSQLVNDYPQSSFRLQAQEGLKALGGLKPRESTQH